MKKTLLGMLFICGITNQLAFSMGIEATSTVPALFSLERLKLARNSFTRALDKYKRCLATGGCTAQEYEQVKRTVNIAGKTALALIAAYLTYTRGLPKAKAKLKKTTGEVTEEAVAKTIAQLKKELPDLTSQAAKQIPTLMAPAKVEALGLMDEAIKQKLSPFLRELKVFGIHGVTFDPKEEEREEEVQEEPQGLVGSPSLYQEDVVSTPETWQEPEEWERKDREYESPF